MKKATTLVSFEDLKEGVLRESGDVFTCDDERGAYLAGLGIVSLEEASKPKPRKKATKKRGEE